MKNIYIDRHLEPLLIETAITDRKVIFSQGEAWWRLTPLLLERLVRLLGKRDGRVFRLVELARNQAADAEEFCARLGVRPDPVAEDQPPAICVSCDAVYYPPPGNGRKVCLACREKELLLERNRPGGGEVFDRRMDALARNRLRETDPELLWKCESNQPSRVNLPRRVERDWDAAVNRILLGHTYKKVARELGCSVGLLHKKVKERYWENN